MEEKSELLELLEKADEINSAKFKINEVSDKIKNLEKTKESAMRIFDRNHNICFYASDFGYRIYDMTEYGTLLDRHQETKAPYTLINNFVLDKIFNEDERRLIKRILKTDHLARSADTIGLMNPVGSNTKLWRLVKDKIYNGLDSVIANEKEYLNSYNEIYNEAQKEYEEMNK